MPDMVAILRSMLQDEMQEKLTLKERVRYLEGEVSELKLRFVSSTSREPQRVTAFVRETGGELPSNPVIKATPSKQVPHVYKRRKIYKFRVRAWTEEEDDRLVELVQARTPYAKIARFFADEFKTERSEKAYSARYWKLVKARNIKGGGGTVRQYTRWSEEEDLRLLELKEGEVTFDSIAETLTRESGIQRTKLSCSGRAALLQRRGITLATMLGRKE